MTVPVRAALAAALLLVGLLTAACIEVGYGYEFEADTSGRFVIVFSLDKNTVELMKLSGEGDPLREFETDVPPGFTAERFEEGERVGVRLTAEFQDVNDLLQKQSLGDLPVPEISEEWSFLTGSFTFRQELSMEEAFGGEVPSLEDFGRDSNLGEPGAPPSLEDILAFSVSLTLPGTITSHNADEVDGNTLKWKPNIFQTQKVVIEAAWQAALPVSSLEVDTTIKSNGSAERELSLRLPQSTQRALERAQGEKAVEDYFLARIPQGTYSSEDSGQAVTHKLSFEAASLDELGRLSAAFFGSDQVSLQKSSSGLLKERRRYREQLDLGAWLDVAQASGNVVARYTLPQDIVSVDAEGATYEGREVELQVGPDRLLDITMETEATSIGRLLLILGAAVFFVGAGLVVAVLVTYIATRRRAGA